ncbi:MAG: oligosaccharide flippase family protein, partial [Clostridia bacterium]|nr:oligosaccharide flippase family protein [Clostridia bacterium]
MSRRAVRFFKNGAVLAASALLMRTVSVAFGAYVTGKVGAEGMGLYSLIMSVYTFAVTFATSGVQLAVTRLVAEALGRGDSAGARAALRTSLGYALAFGSAASLVLFLAAPALGTALLGDGRTVPSLRLLSVALVPVALSSVFYGYFTAVRRPQRSAVVSVAEQGVRIVLTVLALGALLPSGLGYACLALVGGS